jgi:hypothetical protein
VAELAVVEAGAATFCAGVMEAGALKSCADAVGAVVGDVLAVEDVDEAPPGDVDPGDRAGAGAEAGWDAAFFSSESFTAFKTPG